MGRVCQGPRVQHDPCQASYAKRTEDQRPPYLAREELWRPHTARVQKKGDLVVQYGTGPQLCQWLSP